MIAFHLFGRPVYWYGIFYGMTFLFGYRFLSIIWKQSWMKPYTKLTHLFTEKLDSIVLLVILGVIVWWRLGHVFLYDWAYFREHLWEILQTWQGGMSFIWWVIGVTIVILSLWRYYKLRFRDLLLFGDILLCIVPVWILLGRIGNRLNGELWWKPLQDFPVWVQSVIRTVWLETVYPAVDELPRVNTNFSQAFFEWAVPLIVGQVLLWVHYTKKQMRPGLITGVFFIIYGVVRFVVEFLKDLPEAEFRWPLSISQWIMGLFVLGGVLIMFYVYKEEEK